MLAHYLFFLSDSVQHRKFEFSMIKIVLLASKLERVDLLLNLKFRRLPMLLRWYFNSILLFMEVTKM